MSCGEVKLAIPRTRSDIDYTGWIIALALQALPALYIATWSKLSLPTLRALPVVPLNQPIPPMFLLSKSKVGKPRGPRPPNKNQDLHRIKDYRLGHNMIVLDTIVPFS